MKLINTDGMALIGPGSEWSWTALTGIVLAITFIAIYRQLRVQAHARAVEQVQSFDRESTSELMNRCVLEVLTALHDGADLPQAAAGTIADFWETFGALARAGHWDLKLLHTLSPLGASIVWGSLAPWIRKERAATGNDWLAQDFEWLAGAMAEMNQRAGIPAIAPASIESGIERAIPIYQERVRIAQALRTVIVAPPEAVPTPTLAAPPT